MTDAEKVQFMLNTIHYARQKVLDGDLREVWNALYLPAEIERTKRD